MIHFDEHIFSTGWFNHLVLESPPPKEKTGLKASSTPNRQVILQARAPPRAKRNQAEVGAGSWEVVCFFHVFLMKTYGTIIGKSAKIPFLGEQKSCVFLKMCKFPCLCFWSV